jgi:hypothetical protein
MLDSMRVIRWRERPVVAYTNGPRGLRLAGVQCLDAHTRKRRMMRLAGMTACQLGLDGLLASNLPASDVLSEDVFDCLNRCSQALGGVSGVSLVWPADSARLRLYAHFLGDRGDPRGFAKISLGPDDDASLLAEAEAMTHAGEACHDTIHVPRIMQLLEHERGHAVLMESLPRGAHARIPSNPELLAVRDAFAGRTVTLHADQISGLAWVRRLTQEDAAANGWVARLRAILSNGAACCFVHGDYGINNARWFGKKIWIFDWERGCLHGPAMTDVVNIFLGRHARRILAQSASITERFRESHLAGPPSTQDDILLALGYLHAVGSRLATNILNAVAAT